MLIKGDVHREQFVNRLLAVAVPQFNCQSDDKDHAGKMFNRFLKKAEVQTKGIDQNIVQEIVHYITCFQLSSIELYLSWCFSFLYGNKFSEKDVLIFDNRSKTFSGKRKMIFSSD